MTPKVTILYYIATSEHNKRQTYTLDISLYRFCGHVIDQHIYLCGDAHARLQ